MVTQDTPYEQAKSALLRAGNLARTPVEQFDLARALLKHNPEALKILNGAETNWTYCRFRKIMLSIQPREHGGAT